MTDIGLFAALIGGLLSFFSPCVLPLIPIYVSILSGLSYAELEAASRERDVPILARVTFHALMFIIGFSVAFIAMGISASLIGQWLADYRVWITRIGGALVIIFGLYFLGVLKLQWLNLRGGFNWRPERVTAFGAVIMGFVFALAWTPCVSYILAGILTLAADQAQVWKGALLLTVYSAGMAVPFLITAVAFAQMMRVFKKIRGWLPTIEKIAGVFLIVVGILLISGRFTALTSRMAAWGSWFEI